jgi:opacity protein-like surface antigen
MRIVFFSAALIASSTVIAAAPIEGWYSSVFGGITFIPDNINVTALGLTRNDGSYENGFHAGGRLGYKSTPLRYEGELTYLSAKLDHFKVNNIRQTGINGHNSAILAMANVYYDFPDMVPAISPFLGAGIGYAYIKAELNSTGPFGNTGYSGANSVFAYQGTAGFTYNFSENYAVNLAYRYIGTQKPDNLGKVFQANLGTAGVVYRFDGAKYK